MQCQLYNAAGNRILWIDGGESPFEPGGEVDVDRVKMTGRRLVERYRFGQEMTAVLFRTFRGRFALFWNPDGSEEDLCGNAIRCAAHFASSDAEPINDLQLFTPRGSYVARRLNSENGSVIIPARTIRMGAAQANGDRMVDTGSPHCICMVHEEWPAQAVKHAMARSRGFDAVNFDLVRRLGPFHFRVRIFERGVGETFSCGTGATAIVAALGTFDGDGERDTEPDHLVEFASGEQLTVTYRRNLDAFEVAGRVELLLATTIAEEL